LHNKKVQAQESSASSKPSNALARVLSALNLILDTCSCSCSCPCPCSLQILEIRVHPTYGMTDVFNEWGTAIFIF